MEKELAQFSALSHPHRLAIFRLLVRRYPDRLPAGEIGAVLGHRPSTLSAYLAALLEAGLVTRERRGTAIRYGADLAGAQALAGFLIADCCRGRTAAGAPAAPAETAPGRIRNVLFLCSANAARSLMAEAILRDLAGDRFEVFSAGTEAAAAPSPAALETLRAHGHDTAPLWSKPASLFRAGDAPRMDFVVSVCDRAANADAAPWPGLPLHGHWAVPDPLPANTLEAHQAAYAALRLRIAAFAALPPRPRPEMQAAIDAIAALHP